MIELQVYLSELALVLPVFYLYLFRVIFYFYLLSFLLNVAIWLQGAEGDY